MIDPVTPERAREIYQAARTEAMRRLVVDRGNYVVQRMCDDAGWVAVIDAIRRDVDREYAGHMLRLMSDDG